MIVCVGFERWRRCDDCDLNCVQVAAFWFSSGFLFLVETKMLSTLKWGKKKPNLIWHWQFANSPPANFALDLQIDWMCVSFFPLLLSSESQQLLSLLISLSSRLPAYENNIQLQFNFSLVQNWHLNSYAAVRVRVCPCVFRKIHCVISHHHTHTTTNTTLRSFAFS